MIYAISYGTNDHGNKCKNVQRGLMGMSAVMASDTLWFVDTDLSAEEVQILVAPEQKTYGKKSLYVNVKNTPDTLVIRIQKDFSFTQTDASDEMLVDWLRAPERRW